MSDCKEYMYTPDCPFCRFFGNIDGACNDCQHRKTYPGDTISRQAATKLIEDMVSDATSNGISPRLSPDYVISGIKALPSVQLTCEGCKHQGRYDNERECGYNSPCTVCKRIASDNFERGE